VATFYAVGLRALRHLWLWTLGDQPVSMTLTRLLVTVCVVLAGVRLCARTYFILDFQYGRGRGPPSRIYLDGRSGTVRAQVEIRLKQIPGRQLVVVRYASDHNSLDEWVYNAANIDSSKVVSAREMDQAENLELIQYYKDRSRSRTRYKPARVPLYPLLTQEPLSASR
jgi:hypothetical protein